MKLIKPIWVVEDNEDDVELTLAALAESHLANPVVVMRDGSEVLRRLLDPLEIESHPVVILMDIKMPKVSGIDVLRNIKANPRVRNFPIVMLSSSRQGPDIAECYSLGANAYIVKPVESQEFFEAVKAAGKFWAVVNQQPE
jgi:CheY-like chemotaxis protein